MTTDEARQLDASDPLAFARERFRLPEGVIYLDGNSLGALPKAAPHALAETAERQWGEDLIASWNKHGWIDWPTRIAAKLAPIVGAKPTDLLIADSTSVCLFKLLAAAVRARSGRSTILTQRQNFPTDLYVAQGLAEMLGLQPVMTLRSEIIDVQELRAQDAVGYGGTYVAPRPHRIGVIAGGYADGYPRHAPNGTPVVVCGKRVRMAGRVSMDMLTVDLTEVPEARVGTPAVLWGEGLPIDDVAAAASTVGYELMCAVAPRVRFVATMVLWLVTTVALAAAVPAMWAQKNIVETRNESGIARRPRIMAGALKARLAPGSFRSSHRPGATYQMPSRARLAGDSRRIAARSPRSHAATPTEGS